MEGTGAGRARMPRGDEGSPQAVSWEQEQCSGAEQSFLMSQSEQHLLCPAWPRSRAAPGHPQCPDPSALTFSMHPKPEWKQLLGGLRVCFTLNHAHVDLSIPEGESAAPLPVAPPCSKV